MKSPNIKIHFYGLKNPIFYYLFLFFIIALNNNIYSQQPAFPTAYGAGAYTTGGRGGAVIHVTNLNDSGAGSFRQALTTTGPRTIVFDVSGRIQLTSIITLFTAHSNFTVAGQTAPQGGITIGGYPIQIGGWDPGQKCDNFIFRYIKFRNGNTVTQGSPWFDYFQNGVIQNGGENFIYDHCSFSHCYDQALAMTAPNDPLRNGTVQWSIYGDNTTAIIAGLHQYGDIPEGDITIRNNCFVDDGHRNPNIGGDLQFDVINNFTANWIHRTVNVNSGNPEINFIGNRTEDGATGSSQPAAPNRIQGYQSCTIYTANNYAERFSETPHVNDEEVWSGWSWNGQANDYVLDGSMFTQTQFPLLGRSFTITSESQAKSDIIEDVGANKYLNADGSVGFYRDDWDAQKIYNIENEIYGSHIPGLSIPTAINNTRPGDYYVNNSHIPETWFAANVPQGQDHNDLASSGYTWLEEFLNEVDGPISNIPQITRTDSNPTTIEVGGTYTPPTGTWTDVEDGTGTASIGGDTVDVNAIGTYNVTLEHTDSDGNRGYLTIPINVIPEIVNATDVAITPETVSIEEGITTQLIAEFTPATTTDQTGVWSSNLTNIATVNSVSGLVTGEAEGSATITFISNDGSFTDTSTVTVTAQLPIGVPIIDSVVLSGNDYIITFHQEENTAIPSQGYDTLIDGVWQEDGHLYTGYVRTITGLDTSIEHSFILHAQYYQYDPPEYTESNEVTVEPVVGVVNANAGEDKSICENESVTLTASGGPNYLWSTGETTQSIVVSPLETTTYTVTVSNDQSSDSDDVIVTVNPIPIADAGNDVEINQGDSFTLTASGDGTFVWSTGEETQSITVSPSVTTTYTVTATLNACDNSDSVIVTVLEPDTVTANAGEDKTICENESATLTASVGPNYLWSTGETTQSIEVSPSQTTTYTVTVFNDQLSDSDDVVVTVNPIPVAYAGEERAILSGDSIPLTASGGSEFLWSTGETTQEIIVSPTETTTYSVEVFENGCSDIASVTVIVGVSASVGGEQTICQGQSTTLYASGGSYFEWSTGETTQSIEVNPSQTSTYSVIVSNNTSSDEAQITVNVNLVPAADAGEDVTIEAGQNITLTASGGNTYLWSSGDTTQSISVSPTDTTIYTVQTFINGCSNSDDVKVTVVQEVNANAGDDMEICLGETATLTASGGEFYLWSTGEETASISVVPDETTTYTVDVSNGFSSQTADVMVGVLDCQAIENETENFGFEFRVYPNPTDRIVNIKLVGLDNVSSIFISDMTGKVISSESFEHNEGYVINKQYDFASLSRGIYFITFKQSGEAAITKKLILQ